MMIATKHTIESIGENGWLDPLTDRLPGFEERLSRHCEIDIDSDLWNLAPLGRIVGNRRTQTLDIAKIPNTELRVLFKLYALSVLLDEKRLPNLLIQCIEAVMVLGSVLGDRSIETLSSDDFHRAERKIAIHRGYTLSAQRFAGHLQAFGKWVVANTGLSIDYKQRLQIREDVGQWASDEARSNALIPDVVIRSVLELRVRSDLTLRDKFFLSALVIAVATGVRIMELFTLPKDCLVKDGSALLLRLFPGKNGKVVPKVVPPILADIVEEAITYILNETEQGRIAAKNVAEKAEIDYQFVRNYATAEEQEYFFRRLIGNFIFDHRNRLIDPELAWLTSRQEWLPVAQVFKENKGNTSATARHFGIARSTVESLLEQIQLSRSGKVARGQGAVSQNAKHWDSDARIVSLGKISQMMNLAETSAGKGPSGELLKKLVAEGRKAQVTLNLDDFVVPEQDLQLEEKYRKGVTILRDPETGTSELDATDALFVVCKYQLSGSYRTQEDQFSWVTMRDFNFWLDGYSRDLGTKRETDRLFSRFEIVDPRTGDIAKFTTRQIRSWLETNFHNGGLTEQQIASFFNRKSQSLNSVYNQTSMETHANELRAAVEKGFVVGHASRVHEKLSKDSPEEASLYLEAATKFYNPMPHGICLMDMAAEVCPHMLSCFACQIGRNDGPTLCEHLVIDPEDAAQVSEIKRLNRNAASVKTLLIEEGSGYGPQFDHYCQVEKTTGQLLTEITHVKET